jgi:hypothetical protein
MIQAIKKVINQVSTYNIEKKEQQKIILLCQQIAIKEYPYRQWSFSMSSYELGKNGETIVKLCFFDGYIPPARCWWIYKNDKDIKEIPFEEAEKIINIPLWR